MHKDKVAEKEMILKEMLSRPLSDRMDKVKARPSFQQAMENLKNYDKGLYTSKEVEIDTYE